MRTVSSILLVVVVLAIPLNLCAKRVAPPPVNPVVSGNIKYSARGDGRAGYVVASDAINQKELWSVEIFRIHIRPWEEEDNQWVFIGDLKLLDNALLVRDERSRCYRLELTTRHVRETRCP